MMIREIFFDETSFDFFFSKDEPDEIKTSFNQIVIYSILEETDEKKTKKHLSHA